MTVLVVVLVAVALLTGILAWRRRSLAFAGIALLALGVAVWPWAVSTRRRSSVLIRTSYEAAPGTGDQRSVAPWRGRA